MAYYSVKAKPHTKLLSELRQRLNSGEIRKMRPFGTALHGGLDNARVLPDGMTIWEEEDYCSPPLAMERAAVLDTYFTDLSVETVKRDEGWKRIEPLPRFWQ